MSKSSAFIPFNRQESKHVFFMVQWIICKAKDPTHSKFSYREQVHEQIQEVIHNEEA